MKYRRKILAVILILLFVSAFGEGERLATATTQVVILGTGTPRLDPERSGPAVCVVVNDTPYLVDFGPGVVRRAAAAAKKGIGCAPTKVRVAFATHLHSDHTAGLSDLYLSPAVVGRGAALELYDRAEWKAGPR